MSSTLIYILLFVGGYFIKNSSGGLGDILQWLRNLINPSPTPGPTPSAPPSPSPSLLDLLRLLLDQFKKKEAELAEARQLVHALQQVQEAPKSV